MIRIKLCELMGREKMTRKRLSELTGIRPNTIGDLYNENVRKLTECQDEVILWNIVI